MGKDFLENIQSKNEASRKRWVSDLVRELIQHVGNKVYFNELEPILNKLELSRAEEDIVYHLIRDLKFLK